MRRVLLLLPVAAALGALGVAALIAEESNEALPDLDQALPSALSVERSGDGERLAFRSAVDNVGAGPLLVEGRRKSPAGPTMTVRQLIRSENGSERTVRVQAVLRYVRSQTHSHWHLLDFERYELRSAGGRRLVADDRKTGFCLGDRYETDADERIEGEPEGAVWTQECGRGGEGLLTIAEGISPGYGDDYAPVLEGQYVDVTDVPAGRYLLVHRANPERALLESDYGNNAASVLVELRRTGSNPPSVEVLARCPRSARCSPG